MQTQTLNDIGTAIATYTSVNPLLEKFKNAYWKFGLEFEQKYPAAYEAFINARFQRLCEIRFYVGWVSPTHRKKRHFGDRIMVLRYNSHTITHTPLLLFACREFLRVYYQEEYETKMRILWPRERYYPKHMQTA